MPGSSVVGVWNEALLLIGASAPLSSVDDTSPEAQACSIHWDTVLAGALRVADWNFATDMETARTEASVTGQVGARGDDTALLAVSWDSVQEPDIPFVSGQFGGNSFDVLTGEEGEEAEGLKRSASVFRAPNGALRYLDVLDRNDDAVSWSSATAPSGNAYIFVEPADLAPTTDYLPRTDGSGQESIHYAASVRVRYIKRPQPIGAADGNRSGLIPEDWDSAFRAAIVSLLAARIAPGLRLADPERAKALNEEGARLLAEAAKLNSIEGRRLPLPQSPWGRVKYLALDRMGVSPHTRSNVGSSAQASALGNSLAASRERVIRKGRFTFSTRWRELTAADPQPETLPQTAGFQSRAYTLPNVDGGRRAGNLFIMVAGCYLRYYDQSVTEIRWSTQTDKDGVPYIVLDTGPYALGHAQYIPIAKVIADVPDLGAWPEFARSLLAWELALDTFPALFPATSARASQERRREMEAVYAREMAAARADDANAAGQRDTATHKRYDRFTAAGMGYRRRL